MSFYQDTVNLTKSSLSKKNEQSFTNALIKIKKSITINAQHGLSEISFSLEELNLDIETANKLVESFYKEGFGCSLQHNTSYDDTDSSIYKTLIIYIKWLKA